MKHSASRPMALPRHSSDNPASASARQRTVLSAVALMTSVAMLAPENAAAATKAKRSAKSKAAAAASQNTDQQAEIEKLRRQLEAVTKENERLRQSVAAGAPAPAAPAEAAAPAAAETAVAENKAEGEDLKTASGKEFVREKPTALGEMVVQARRKEEKLQDVPIPIAVVTGEMLKRDNIVNVQDISRRVPNLGVTSANTRQTSIALRGLGKNAGNESMESSVGVQVDNVWNTWVGSTWTNYTDIDHVEVLRGPQGTLQGKNSNLGLLNIVTKLPSFTPSYYVDGFAGDRNSLQGKAAATGPILPGLLAYRASLYVDRRDGFIQNFDRAITVGKLQETNALGGRLQFLLTPSETLSARIIVDKSSSTQSMSVTPLINDPQFYTDGVARSSSFTSRMNRGWFSYLTNSGQPLYVIGNPRAIAEDAKQASRGDQEGVSGEINWDVLGHKLTSISAYRYALFEPHHDGDHTVADIQRIGGVTVQNRQWSQEFRFASKEPGPVDYQVGIFALRQSASTLNQSLYGYDAGAFYASNSVYKSLYKTALGRDILAKSGDNVYLQEWLHPETTSLAGFGQLNWHITDAATLTLGLRDTWEHRDNQGYHSYTGGYNLNSLKALGATTTQINQAKTIRSTIGGTVWSQGRQGFDQNSQNWLASPSYKFNEDLMVYFSVSGGQKSGAAQFDAYGNIANVKPEDITDIELGLKSTWLNRRLTANINVYNTDITGFQAQLQKPVPLSVNSTGYQNVLGNVNGIQLRGVEMETAWQATKDLSFFFNGSYNHAVYTDYKNAPCPAEIDSKGKPCNQTGRQIPNAPLFTANYGVDYRTPLGLGVWDDYGLEWHAFLVDSWKSKANYSPSLSAAGTQPGYHVTDGGLGVGTKNGQYSLNFVVRNIFDTVYLTNVAQFTSSAAATGVYGDARYYGLQFRANY